VVAAVILGVSYVAGRAMQRPVVVVRAVPRVETSAGESVGVTVSESASESESESESTPTSTIATTSTTTRSPQPRPHRDTVVATTTTTTAPPAPHERTLEELLEAPLCCGHATTTHATTAPVPALPATPSRDDVMSAMRAVSVAECGPEHGIANVRITVASTGRVSGAVVSGPLAGTAAGSCVARAVRSATFPRFAQSSFVLSYPFRI